MRRIATLILLAGCFSEPPVKTSTESGITLTTSAEESSSSTAGDASSSEGVEGGSSTSFDPRACPEWCTETCDNVVGFQRCRCTNDAVCSLGGLTCHVPAGEALGHCY